MQHRFDELPCKQTWLVDVSRVSEPTRADDERGSKPDEQFRYPFRMSTEHGPQPRVAVQDDHGLRLHVAGRVGALHPKVNFQLRAGHAVVNRQIGDTGFQQHVLAQQALPGV
jgi:hypothetical protein